MQLGYPTAAFDWVWAARSIGKFPCGLRGSGVYAPRFEGIEGCPRSFAEHLLPDVRLRGLANCCVE